MVSPSWFSGSCPCLLLTLLTFVTCLGAKEANGAELTASWVDNSYGSAATRIERRLAADTEFVAVADVPPGSTTYVDGSVGPGTTYCYRALAYDASGVSPYTEEVCTTSAGEVPVLTVTASKTGSGDGTVASTPEGILCGTVCSATYTPGVSVTLAATPAAGSTFTGWSGGGCAGTEPCVVAGNAPVSVTADFSRDTSPLTYPLTVSIAGPGSVASTPSGINCSSTCSAEYAGGAQVTLTAKPNNSKMTFHGWTDGCAGSSPTCTVTMQAATKVLATFKKRVEGKASNIGAALKVAVEDTVPTR